MFLGKFYNVKISLILYWGRSLAWYRQKKLAREDSPLGAFQSQYGCDRSSNACYTRRTLSSEISYEIPRAALQCSGLKVFAAPYLFTNIFFLPFHHASRLYFNRICFAQESNLRFSHNRNMFNFSQMFRNVPHIFFRSHPALFVKAG